jgi:CMP/dCMP kinase
MNASIEFLKTVSPLRITVSGEIGSGKSTFAKHLAIDLNIERLYIGLLNREEAARRGMTVDAFSKLLETNDAFDRAVDALQTQKSRERERGIFEGRTAFYFVENPTVKLFFTIDPRISAERVLQDENNPNRDKYHSVEEVLEANVGRRAAENKRYQAYYGLDVYDPNHFDVVVDTSHLTIEEVYVTTVEKIAKFLQKA